MAPLEAQSGPQREFLASDADIAVYGGAAGGGKSWALLVDPLRYIDVPGFAGIIFRRTYPEITNAGGLWDEASEIYPGVGGRGVVGVREWRFPSGAKIAFRHLENEATKFAYQGSQICDLAFDELTHFSEGQFWYLLSRNRSTCGVRPYVRATCNPDPGWVKDLLSPWVDDGFAGERAVSGELRWFVRVDGAIRWVDRDHPDAKSLTFIRASVFDNEILLRHNPEYVATLRALPPVERARLLDGDWNVRREGLVYPGFDACVRESPDLREIDQDRMPTVGGIDFGINNPFAALWGHLDGDDVLWITGMRYQRQVTIPIHAEAIPKGVEYHCDPAGAQERLMLQSHGHRVRPCVHIPVRGASGELKKPLLAGIDMVSERIRTGRLRIIRPACLPLVRELGMYHYDPDKRIEEPVKEDDHACDALRYLVVGLDRNRGVPGVAEAADAERDAQALADREAERLAALERQRAAQADPDDPRWWT